MSSSESIATPVRPTSPSRERVVGVVAELRRQVEGDREARLAAREQVRKRSFVSSAEPNPAYWRIVHGRPRYMSGYGPRVNGNAPGASSAPGARRPARTRASPRWCRRADACHRCRASAAPGVGHPRIVCRLGRRPEQTLRIRAPAVAQVAGSVGRASGGRRAVPAGRRASPAPTERRRRARSPRARSARRTATCVEIAAVAASRSPASNASTIARCSVARYAPPSTRPPRITCIIRLTESSR